MIRYIALLFAFACGAEEPPTIVEGIVEDPLVDVDVSGDPQANATNTVGGKEIPTTAARTNDPVANADPSAEGGGTNMASDGTSGRPPLVSVPVEGELPGVRRVLARQGKDLRDDFAEDGDGLQVRNEKLERQIASEFIDEEFDESKFQEMKDIKKSGENKDWKPDPDRYKDPRNYAANHKK